MKTPHRSSASALNRREFLRGVGACIALPTMMSLLPQRLLASEVVASGLAKTPTGAPLRTAFLTVPNGAIADAWWPVGGETDFQLNATLKPLENLRPHLQILGGLDQVNAQPRGDGGGDHARGQSVFLTGARPYKSEVDVRAGISIDQAIANKVGAQTRFSSLEMTCDSARTSSVCDSGYACAYQYNASWKSSSTPMPPENNPRVIFERLFGEGGHGERAANAVARLRNRRSVLDFVLDDTARLNRRLDRPDQEKLDQYLTGVRDIERRIQQTERFGPNLDPNRATPSGIPEHHTEYMELMLDMLVLAFQTDSTRVATFMFAHDGDNRSFSEIGISEGHHELSHHKHDADRVKKVAQIEKYYVERLASFLRKLEATRDVDGNSLLHNSQIMYGSGNADGNIHTHVNLPIILAGGGGGTLRPGRFVQYDSQPLCNLFLNMAERAGAGGMERFGDSTGLLRNV